jgi:hypothetical protein
MVTGVDPGHLRHSPACRRRTLETATSRRARCCLAHQFVHAPSGHGAIGPARRPAACAFQIGARRGGVAAPGREIAAFIEPLPACLALEPNARNARRNRIRTTAEFPRCSLRQLRNSWLSDFG